MCHWISLLLSRSGAAGGRNAHASRQKGGEETHHSPSLTSLLESRVACVDALYDTLCSWRGWNVSYLCEYSTVDSLYFSDFSYPSIRSHLTFYRSIRYFISCSYQHHPEPLSESCQAETKTYIDYSMPSHPSHAALCACTRPWTQYRATSAHMSCAGQTLTKASENAPMMHRAWRLGRRLETSWYGRMCGIHMYGPSIIHPFTHNPGLGGKGKGSLTMEGLRVALRRMPWVR